MSAASARLPLSAPLSHFFLGGSVARGIIVGNRERGERASRHPAGIAGMSIVVLFCVLNDRKNNKSGAPNALEWPITKIGGEGKWEDRDDDDGEGGELSNGAESSSSFGQAAAAVLAREEGV